MTISTETVFKRYSGNGATTSFSFPYHFFENGDLVVNLEAKATGVATLQVLDTDYTVTGADDPEGGTVLFTGAPSDAVTVVIFRKPDLSQTVNLTAFSASAINDALDRLYEHLQYFEWVRSRMIGLPDTQAGATLTLPFSRAEKVLGFDGSGNVTTYPAADAIAAQAAQDAAETAADLALHLVNNPAIGYRFKAGTADENPGTGYFTLNHATPASVTQVYFANAGLDGNTVSAWIDTFDNANNPGNLGTLIIKGTETPQAIIVAKVSGSVVDGGGYRKVPVTVVSSGGTFTATEPFSVFFASSGDDGEVSLALLASTANGEGASLVGIEDAGGYYSGDDVEAALQEAGAAIVALENATPATATTSAQGIVELATDAEIRSGATASGALVVTAASIETACQAVALSSSSNATAVDWDSGIYFTLTTSENTAISNPTNGQPGTSRMILVQGNNTTDRTITFGNQFLGATPTITDCDSGKWYLLFITCLTASHFVVSAQVAKA